MFGQDRTGQNKNNIVTGGTSDYNNNFKDSCNNSKLLYNWIIFLMLYNVIFFINIVIYTVNMLICI